MGKSNLAPVRAVDHLNLNNTVPWEGDISFSELDQKAKIHPFRLDRLLMYCFTFRLFQELRPGFVAHDALSLVVPKFSPMIWVNSSKMVMAAFNSVPEAVERWPRPPKERQIPLQLTMNTDKRFFKILGEISDGPKKFSAGMKSKCHLGGLEPSCAIRAFDWKSFGGGPITDVDGADGQMSITFANAFPGLHIIVQDRPANEEKATAAISEDLSERVKFMAHDFFKPRPELPAVYIP